MVSQDDVVDKQKLNLYIKFLKERLFFEPQSVALHYNLGLAYISEGTG